MAANQDVLAYLIEGAKRRGIDPATVTRAFGHEGLNVFDPNQPDRGGDEGSSFGPYQLHYAGMSKSMPNAGMGDDFTRATGLDARDSSTWRQQTDFVLDHLANGGSWKPWMGAAAEGITGRMGLPGGQPGAKPGEASVADYRAGNTGGKPVFVGAAPVTPFQDAAPAAPGTAVASATPAAGDKKGWRTALSKAMTGFKMPAMAKSDPNAGMPAMPAAARVDTPEMASFDPNQIANQRQQLAMAMQRLNSGKLWL
jgi:hypothetical protein